MQHQGDSLSVTVCVIAPPYERFGPATDLGHVRQHDLPRGAIFGLELDGRLHDVEYLSAVIARVRHSFPAVPLVLRIHRHLDVETAHLIQLVTQLHVRGVVVDGEPVREALRGFLTTPVDLATDVVEWLSLRLPRLPPQVAELCRQIFRNARAETEVVSLLERAGESARTARARFQKLSLPAPSCWLQAARALHAALTLQRAHSTPLFELAMELGYSDHSALSHQLLRMFGLRASEIRRLLGWEWLLDSWLARRTALVPVGV